MPRRAALYGRCPWQGLCLLPASRRRRAWGAGVAARRQLPWPSPPRRTSCRCPVSGAGPSEGTELRAAGRVGGTSSACGGPWPLPPPRRHWAPSPAAQRPLPGPGRAAASPSHPALRFSSCPGSLRPAGAGAPRRGAGLRAAGSGRCLPASGEKYVTLTSEIRRGQPCCRHRHGIVVQC